MGKRIENCYMEEFLEEIEYGMNLTETKEKLESTFIIIGKLENGDMKCVIVGQDTGFEIKDIPTNSVYFIGGTIPIKEIKEICKRNSEAIRSPFELLRKIIEDVSNIDKTINKNIFFKVI